MELVFLFNFCFFPFSCTCVHVCIHVYMCGRECLWRSVTLPPCSLKQNLNQTQSSPMWLVSLARSLRTLQEGRHPCLPLTWILGTRTWVFTFFVARALTTKSSPQLQNVSSDTQRHTAMHVSTHRWPVADCSTVRLQH